MVEFSTSLRRGLCAVSLSCLGAVSMTAALAQPSPPASGPGMGHQGMGPGGHGGMDMHGAMMQGMESMRQMKPTGDADRDFAAMMKMHHQQAVEMSQAYLQQAKSPELRQMAQKIIRDQQKEIAQLDKWLQGRK
ncbi:DUF305 domain-containing protein [Azohydromonas aeria]|uniref:DUF305 domain-containing protein n=1 Tax=Azohydromonas aeria TaxID=2590212 RepID=UPI001E61E92D|nr:DUF305 domain-containing protein [Azohydromonas aeria]